MKKSFVSFVFIISIILISCKDNVTNIYNLSKPGNIMGRVTISYDYGNDSTYNGGVNVWIPGTNFQTVSDSSGYWSLDSVPQGIYDIYFYKDGCDTTERYAFQFVGNGIAYNGSNVLYKIPKANIILDSVSAVFNLDTSKFIANIYGHTDKDTRVSFLFDTVDNLSKYNYWVITTNTIFSYREFNLQLTILMPKFLNMGKTVYLTAYPGTPVNQTDYRKPGTRIIGLGKQSNVLSFIVNY